MFAHSCAIMILTIYFIICVTYKMQALLSKWQVSVKAYTTYLQSGFSVWEDETQSFAYIDFFILFFIFIWTSDKMELFFFFFQLFFVSDLKQNLQSLWLLHIYYIFLSNWPNDAGLKESAKKSIACLWSFLCTQRQAVVSNQCSSLNRFHGKCKITPFWILCFIWM